MPDNGRLVSEFQPGALSFVQLVSTVFEVIVQLEDYDSLVVPGSHVRLKEERVGPPPQFISHQLCMVTGMCWAATSP